MIDLGLLLFETEKSIKIKKLSNCNTSSLLCAVIIFRVRSMSHEVFYKIYLTVERLFV